MNPPNLRQLRGTCPVSYWRFAGPVALGNAAGLGIGYLTQRAMRNDHPTTAKTAGTIAGVVSFWLVAGTAWIAWNRNPE